MLRSLMVLLMFLLPAFPPLHGAPVQVKNLDVSVTNPTKVSDQEALSKLSTVMALTPEFAHTRMKLCVGKACQQLDLTAGFVKGVDLGTAFEAGWADDVAAIVSRSMRTFGDGSTLSVSTRLPNGTMLTQMRMTIGTRRAT